MHCQVKKAGAAISINVPANIKVPSTLILVSLTWSPWVHYKWTDLIQRLVRHHSPIMDTLVSKYLIVRYKYFQQSTWRYHYNTHASTFPAMMKIDGARKPTITGGPLINGTYEFAQLHFHWGGNDTIGSEKTFDKKCFPLELHIVFFKQEYLNIDAALEHKDGLTVLACIFEVKLKNEIGFVFSVVNLIFFSSQTNPIQHMNRLYNCCRT